MANLLERASVVLTPTAYNNGEALCIKPDDGSGDFDFSRNSAATRVNAQGLVETIGINLPRINYEGFSFDGSGNIIPDSGCGSWLFEPQSTNLITQSEDLTSWSNGGSTLTSGLTSPSGDNTAYSVLSGSGTSNRVQLTTNGLSVSTEHSVSVFVKKVGADNKATLIFETAETGRQGVSFNFDTKTLSNASGTTSNRQVQQLTNDWFRISYTFTTAATITSPNIQLNRSNPSQAAIYWGAQVEVGNISSYIPTSGSTVTRNQYVCTNGGSLATINSTEGVLYAEIAALANDGTRRYISLNDGTSANDVRLYFDAVANKLIALGKVSGITQFVMDTTSFTLTDFNKIAVKFSENDFALWVNGAEVDTDTSGLVNAPNTFNQLTFDGNGLKFFGKTKCLAVWKEALSDQELTELTTI